MKERDVGPAVEVKVGCGLRLRQWWVGRERGVREREAVRITPSCSGGTLKLWQRASVLVTCDIGVGDLQIERVRRGKNGRNEGEIKWCFSFFVWVLLKK